MMNDKEIKAHDQQNLEALREGLLSIRSASLKLAGLLVRGDLVNLNRSIMSDVETALMRVDAASQTSYSPPGEEKAPMAFSPLSSSILSPNGLFFDIHETSDSGGIFSSWFRFGGYNTRLGSQGIVGAGHSVDSWPGGMGWQAGMPRNEWPEWTKRYRDDEIILWPGGEDIALFGVVLPSAMPPQLMGGERVILRGTPAGIVEEGVYTTRVGTAYLERNEGDQTSWIIVFDDGQRTAMGGMSGGTVSIVDSAKNETLVGVIITRNSRATIGDQSNAHSSDITELHDVVRTLKRLEKRS